MNERSFIDNHFFCGFVLHPVRLTGVVCKDNALQLHGSVESPSSFLSGYFTPWPNNPEQPRPLNNEVHWVNKEALKGTKELNANAVPKVPFYPEVKPQFSFWFPTKLGNRRKAFAGR